MTHTVQAVFDGMVFRPLAPVKLDPDTECELAIEPMPSSDKLSDTEDEVYVLSAIAAMAIDMGVTDLADGHREFGNPVVKDS